MFVLLLAGPVLFFAGIVIVSVVLSVRGTEPTLIAERVPLLAPHILLGVLLSLAVLLFMLSPAIRRVWVVPSWHDLVIEIAVGVLAGVGLALAYLLLLAPALEYLQRSVGDYVPPGSVLSTVSSSVGIFFLANVLLAPLVEETLYRGYAIPVLTERFGLTSAVVLSCAFFGLLHWPGGFWYMLLTGGMAGGAFAALFVWSGSVWAPFAAHLSLNAIEFFYAWRIHVDTPTLPA